MNRMGTIFRAEVTGMFGIQSTGLTLGGLSVRWYGLLIVAGMLLGILLASLRERRLGLPRETAVDLALWGIPAAIVGARLYYVIFSWESYADNPVSALYIWEGGLAIYGGLIGGLAAGLIYARVKRLNFLKLADLAAPSFALGQAVGRWGNFFNQEAYGIPVASERLRFFPVAVRIEADGLWHYATFFYESLWCLVIVLTLLLLERRGRLKRPGDVFFGYVLMYGLERALVEGLRTDSLYLGPVRVSQALSLIAAGAALIALLRRKRKEKREQGTGNREQE